MKLLVIGSLERIKKYMPAEVKLTQDIEYVEVARGSSDEEILAAAADADLMIADPMSVVSGNVIRNMPNLKMIHSEGVAFNQFDIDAAKECGVYVCNCKGCNALSVAEQTMFLILGLLRDSNAGQKEVYAGHQIAFKENCMKTGRIRELSECRVGLIGMGDIAKVTVKLLKAFDAEIVYWNHNRRSEKEELEMGIHYLEMDELLATSDIVSLHVAVTPETMHMADQSFFEKMKADAYFINTSRGDLVENEALYQAILDGQIKGAGLDTISPEPFPADHILFQLPEEKKKCLLLSPHIGGITGSGFRRSNRMIWEDFQDLLSGKRPKRIVNAM